MPNRAKDINKTTCGGTGIFVCRCDGDSCSCANGGHVECPGCSDCEIEMWLAANERHDDPDGGPS